MRAAATRRRPGLEQSRRELPPATEATAPARPRSSRHPSSRHHRSAFAMRIRQIAVAAIDRCGHCRSDRYAVLCGAVQNRRYFQRKCCSIHGQPSLVTRRKSKDERIMKTGFILGGALLVSGAAALGHDYYNYTTVAKTLQAGPLASMAERTTATSLQPIIGWVSNRRAGRQAPGAGPRED